MRLLRFIDNCLKVTTICMILLIVLSIFLQIFFRYFLNRPLIWTEELARISGIYGMLIAAALVQKENGHLGLTLFREEFSIYSIILSNVICFAFVSILFIPSIKFSLVSRNVTSAALGLSYLIWHLSITIGFLLMAIYSLINIIKNILILISRRGKCPSQ